MAKIALCWELGKGSGHLAILAEFVEPLKQQGHDVCLIVQNLATTNNIAAFAGLEVYQAPILLRSVNEYQPINFSSVLLMCGYDHPDNLAAALSAWARLYNDLNIECVIAEHSPTALLAAHLVGVHHAMVGFGFVMPPLTEPMSPMFFWQKHDKQQLVAEDNRLISCVNESLQTDVLSPVANVSEFNSVKEMFSSARQVLVTLPEFDHYGVREQPYYMQTTPLYKANRPVWPESDLPKVFVYMDGQSPHLMKLLEQLGDAPYSVLMVVPNIQAELVERYSTATLLIQPALVDIQQVVDQCRLIINHAAHQTLVDFLKMGIPCIMLPDTVERTMLAIRLGAQGLGFAGSTNSENIDIVKMLGTARQADHIWQLAKNFSAKYQNSTDMNISVAIDEVMQNVV